MSGLPLKITMRCIECGDCLLWTGRVSSHGGLPEMHVEGKGNRHVRPIAYAAYHGKVPKGRVVSTTCGEKMCLAREHLVALTPKRSKQLAAERGAYSNPAKHRKGVLTKISQSWITDEVIEKVKAASTAIEASRLTGVSPSYAKSIRNGKARAPVASWVSGLGARA